MDLRKLILLPAVQEARTRVVACDAETLREQLRVVAIPAPTLKESERARYVADRFREIGLSNVSIDEAGNALGQLPYPADPDAPPLVVAAHLDTVFPEGTDLTLREDGQHLCAPGIADNARGVAVLITLAQVLTGLRVRTERPVWFVGTVGEEGSGDLVGVKHLFRPGAPLLAACAFVALDGTGIRRVVNRAIGARRLRVTVRGPGGHSWADWGVGNPINALGCAVAQLRRRTAAAQPAVALTVARFSGGSSINSIPAEAWMELDLRSEDVRALARTEAEVMQVVTQAVEQENRDRRHGSAALRVETQTIGDRPGGVVAEDSVVVRAALAATRAVGARPELGASSTDANVPISLGIPSVTLGAGGDSGGIHTTGEWYANRDATRSVERALLTVLALAEVDSVGG